MHVIGVTASRHGLNSIQRRLAVDFLTALGVTEFHHGDCVGGDAETHDIARSLNAYVIVHPPIKTDLRAYKEGDETRVPKSYLVRNRCIVSESEVMLAFPSTENDPGRGGTWYTIRYAIGQGVKLYLIKPSGNVEEYN